MTATIPPPPHLYFVAGEASGDSLGAKLMAALKRLRPEIRFSGLGGHKMQAEGLEPLFDIRELSLMGFVEILPHIFRLRRRLREVQQDILAKQPDIIITIDSPGFNFRLVRALRAHPQGKNFTFVHYVAPSVWAYKPGRAAQIAPLFDKLLTLLPFEPPYFLREGLPTRFTGHPVLEEDFTRADAARFREQHGILPNAPLLLLLPGSRPAEIRRHLHIFLNTLEQLTDRFGDLTEVIVVPPNMRDEVQQELSHWPGRPIIVTETAEKHDAFAAATVALVKSGTISLELACAQVPMVVTYRVSPLSAWLLRRMIKVPFVSLVNILLDREVIPELLQENCTPDKLAQKLAGFLISKDKGNEQIQQASPALAMLIPDGDRRPSDLAAEEVLKLLG